MTEERKGMASKIYTGKGDKGHTGLLCRGKMTKSSPWSWAIGSLDTLHAEILFLGSMRVYSKCVKNIVIQIMKINSFLATKMDNIKYAPTEEDVSYLEEIIDELTPLKVEKKFFIMSVPHDEMFCRINKCRTLAREIERRINELEKTHEQLGAYVNRLSSVFYVMALHRVDSTPGLSLVYQE